MYNKITKFLFALCIVSTLFLTGCGSSTTVKKLGDGDKSREAIEQSINRAIEEVKMLTEGEQKSTAATGACCLYTLGVEGVCTNSMTYKACWDAGRKAGVMWKWSKAKKCSNIDCK